MTFTKDKSIAASATAEWLGEKPRQLGRQIPTSRRLAILNGPVRKTLFLLALPVLGEQMLNTMVGTFDVFLAGSISPAATSAIGLAAYVSWLASLMVMLVGTGTTAIVSRHEGQGDHTAANHFANQSMTLAVVLGVTISLGMYVFAPWFAHYCNMTGEAHFECTNLMLYLIRNTAELRLFQTIPLPSTQQGGI